MILKVAKVLAITTAVSLSVLSTHSFAETYEGSDFKNGDAVITTERQGGVTFQSGSLTVDVIGEPNTDTIRIVDYVGENGELLDGDKVIKLFDLEDIRIHNYTGLSDTVELQLYLDFKEKEPDGGWIDESKKLPPFSSNYNAYPQITDKTSNGDYTQNYSLQLNESRSVAWSSDVEFSYNEYSNGYSDDVLDSVSLMVNRNFWSNTKLVDTINYPDKPTEFETTFKVSVVQGDILN